MEIKLPYSRGAFRMLFNNNSLNINLSEVSINSNAGDGYKVVNTEDTVCLLDIHNQVTVYNINTGRDIHSISSTPETLTEIVINLILVDKIEVGSTYWCVDISPTSIEPIRNVMAIDTLNGNGTSDSNLRILNILKMTKNLFYNRESAKLYGNYLKNNLVDVGV